MKLKNPNSIALAVAVFLFAMANTAAAQGQYPPGVMYATLLDNVTVIAKTGEFRLKNKMQNVFVPEGATGRAVLSSGGKEVWHWDWKTDAFGLRPPYKLFGFSQPFNPDGSLVSYDDLKLTKPGDYVFDLYLGNEKMYTMPFSLRVKQPDDPFDGGALYLTDGPWNDWGYLFYSEADPEQNLAWKIWLRAEENSSTRKEIRVEVKRDKDGKLICENRRNTSTSLRSDWVRHSFDLVNPPVKTSGGAYFKAKDLLAVDGGYTLTMTVEGKPYGTWKFKVAGGKLSHTGRTVRGEADPLRFIEGGKDAWWYSKVD
ncbi:MAG: hypothetical protein IPM63_03590 [Acidobacteriota bacterium]|nr:MAG: hypothetical protein IPM63_03590 [Acidobacteriota bacterium]